MDTTKTVDEAPPGMVIRIAEPETHLTERGSEPGPGHETAHKTGHRKQPDPLARPAKDPMNALIEELRGEFRRGYMLEDAQRKAAKRKRDTLLVILLLLAGVILVASLFVAGHRLH